MYMKIITLKNILMKEAYDVSNKCIDYVREDKEMHLSVVTLRKILFD